MNPYHVVVLHYVLQHLSECTIRTNVALQLLVRWLMQRRAMLNYLPFFIIAII
jgi:hypothetical protein